MGSTTTSAIVRTSRRLRQLGYVARHPLAHARLMREMDEAHRAGLAPEGRAARWKYLGDYLLNDASPRFRASALATHYRLLHGAVPAIDGRRSWGEGFVLWQREVDERRYALRLEHATFSAMEGETQLSLYQDGARLFTLTFSIVDGASLGLAAERALFIGGMQGALGTRDASREAARHNGEIAPAAMVMLAAQAMARALRIETIAAVSGARQASIGYAADKIRFRYDEFWQQLGAEEHASGHFLVGARPAERSLDHLSGSHRARARRKAERKAEMVLAMERTACARLALAMPWPSCERPTLVVANPPAERSSPGAAFGGAGRAELPLAA